MDNTAQVSATFAARAPSYDAESLWVTDPSIVNQLIPKPFGSGRFLDICMGTGIVAEAAMREGWSAVGIDLSLAMLNVAKHRIERVVCSRGEQVPFKSDGFDVVACRQALQYLTLETALDEMFRLAHEEVRLAHITLEEPRDKLYWRDYFALASPGRRHIFAPGELYTFCKRRASVVHSWVGRCRGSLRGPIAHLPADTIKAIETIIRTAPSWWQDNYEMRETPDGDFEYTHRWEFIVARK